MLTQQLSLLQSDSVAFDRLRRQVAAVFPEVASISYGKVHQADLADTLRQRPLVLVEWISGRRDRAFLAREAQLDSFLRISLPVDSLRILSVRESR